MALRFFRHYWQLHLALLAVTDFVLSFAAQLSIYALDGREEFNLFSPPEQYVRQSALFAAVVFVSIAAMGLYSARQRWDFIGVIMRLLLATALGSAIFSLGAWVFFIDGVSATRQLIAAALAFLSCLVAHLVMEKAGGEDVLKRKILVYGAGKRAESLTKLRRRSDRRGFAVVGYVPAEGDDPSAVMSGELLPRGTPLREHCERLGVDEVVVAMDERRQLFPMDELFDCRLAGIEVVELISFLERETGKLRLDVLNPSWMVFSEGFRRGRIHAFFERLLDIVASLGVLVIGLPIMLITILAIKIEDGVKAAVFYRQRRVGQYGNTFQLLKFRSMREDAEVDGKPRWATKNDSRVTRVGSLIRKLRIDELPQVLNVLRGEMSFVGPRPERPEFVSQLNERLPYYRERHNIKPGITGWAQLCYPYGSSEQDALEKLQYDLFYVKNHTLLFYVAVLIQTIEVVLWKKGAR